MNSVRIPLPHEHEAIIDEEDYELISRHNWYISSRGKYTYAYTWGGSKHLPMHELLLGTKWVDHANGDTLDNRRENLRPTTNSFNQANSFKQKNTSSKYKGVTRLWDRKRKKWRAVVIKDGVYYRLGNFETEEEAGRAYDAKAKELFGEFARVNFPDD